MMDMDGLVSGQTIDSVSFDPILRISTYCSTYLLIPPIIIIVFPSTREGGRTTGIGNPPRMRVCINQSYAGIAGPEQGGHDEKEESRNGRGQTRPRV